MATQRTDSTARPGRRSTPRVTTAEPSMDTLATTDGASAPQPTSQSAEVSNEARYVMVQEAAYWRAERRGFEPGFELEDWLAAENEVDNLLGAGRSAGPQ
jgi:hypothetical protein